MPAKEQHLKIEQGATYELEIDWNDSNGDPVDTSQYTIRSQIRETYDSASTLVDLSEGDGISIPEQGTIVMTISATRTGSMPTDTPNRWSAVWDMEAEHTDGTVIRILQGRVMILPEVTQGS